jgi:hypothetical protein
MDVTEAIQSTGTCASEPDGQADGTLQGITDLLSNCDFQNDNAWRLRSTPPNKYKAGFMTKELSEEDWEEVRRTVKNLRAGQISRASAENTLRDIGVPKDAIPVILMYIPAKTERGKDGEV